MASYPPPDELMNPPSVNPRPGLAPLEVAPTMVSFDIDAIPPVQLHSFTDCPTHTASLHFTPAAFPRCASTPGQIVIPEGLDKGERKEWVKKTAMDLILEKRALERDLVKGRGKIEEGPDRVVGKVGLWNAVLRIRRTKGTLDKGVKGITIVATHANGFHKETWEVPFRRLVDLSERPGSSIRIQDIWILECVDHGDSALANGSNFPRLADRSDYGRDIANFCLHYIPTRGTENVPSRLVRVDEAISRNRQRIGFEEEGRIMVGVGHSLGGDAMTHCALNYPDIFQQIVLSETTLRPGGLGNNETVAIYIGGALARRAEWFSREEAKKLLLKAPLYSALHPDVFESYLHHALYEDRAKEGVRLKCSPESEARQFNELLSMNEGWEQLRSLDEKVALHWIMGGRADASNMVGGYAVAQNTVWRRAKNSSNVRIPGAGHLVVQEKPMEYAAALFEYLSKGHEREKYVYKPRL